MPGYSPVRSNFDLQVVGEVRLTERGEGTQHANGWWTYEEGPHLVERDDVDVTVAVASGGGPEDAIDGIKVALSGHHLTNPGSDRAFHASIDVSLDWDDVERLMLFLTYAVAAHHGRR
jgi:hypothetical protein